MHIVHITPALPPTINGLGDFSKIVVDNLKTRGYNNNSYLVYDAKKYSNEIAENVIEFKKETFYISLQKLRPDKIFLHYVGYAYDKNGCPFYLYNSLQQYKKKYPCTILIFFHELYSSSNNPLKIPFYSGFFQKRLVKYLYKLAFVTFTSCKVYQMMLEELLGDAPCNVVCTGIFSNISDDYYNKVEAKENSLMVVFGSYSKRLEVYKNPRFIETLKKRNIKEIYDIGPGLISFSHPFITYTAKGALPPAKAAALLNKARFGAIDYPAELLAKSGIFSAYAAFGVIAINTSREKEKLFDNLVCCKNYFNTKTEIRDADFETIQKEVTDWYSTRSSSQITTIISKFLN